MLPSAFAVPNAETRAPTVRSATVAVAALLIVVLLDNKTIELEAVSKLDRDRVLVCT